MRMGILDLPVVVFMGMPERTFSGKSLKIIWRVITLVMGIDKALLSSARIVPVAMSVAVVLRQQQGC